MSYADATIIVPVRDEPAVGAVVRDIFKTVPGCKVIVIYKGSVDGLPKHRRLIVMEQRDSGKGKAMVEAARHVTTPIMCFVDGDETYDTKDLIKVIEQVRQGADLALGARVRLGRGAMTAKIRFGNGVLTFLANLFFGLRLKDSQTGLRAIRKQAFDKLHLRETHFGIEEEMNIMSRKRHLVIREVPISYYARKGTVAQHSKNVGGFKLLGVIFKLLFR
ncbi:MAG: glycosyltransferase family 2 protein [Candidatus Micrarchaeales archaeon]|nr:glycosyltransferase family 2 protein [Candidatus Micrarchaeales archaeon]